MIRCINIDWLEVFCYEDSRHFPLTADKFRADGWIVNEREYGTRVYGQMFTLHDTNNNPFLEIRRNPLSEIGKDGGLFPKESCHIRLSNYYCYHENPVNLLREFLNRYQYILVRIYRIDICNDFTKFDRGDDPQKFIKRYINGKYAKVNQSNISAHGEDRWDGQVWTSLSWGKQKSMISTKFYCKSIEMRQVKDKPYIRNAWFSAGLIDNPITGEKREGDLITVPNVWRVEFSIKSSAKKWYIIENSDTRKTNTIAMPHTLDIYDSKDRLEYVFASLARHYFRFKIPIEGKRKDRCQDKVLFEFNSQSSYYKIDRQASHEPCTTKEQRLINALLLLKERSIETKTRQAIDTVVSALRHTQINNFSGSEMTAEDILILQRLISRRMAGDNTKDIAEQRKEIMRIIKAMEDVPF